MKRFGKKSAKNATTPLEIGEKIFSQHSEPTNEKYRERIGALMYVMVGTLLDITFSVITLAKFVERPFSVH